MREPQKCLLRRRGISEQHRKAGIPWMQHSLSLTSRTPAGDWRGSLLRQLAQRASRSHAELGIQWADFGTVDLGFH